MYRILVDFTKLLAPILCFTAQEIWSYIPKTPGMKDYVVWERMPQARPAADEAFTAKWARIMAVRDEVKKVLEAARADKTIGSSLEAAVTLTVDGADYALLNAIPMDELADLFIVSHVELARGETLLAQVARAGGEKCLRCWKYDPATDAEGLCPRCRRVLGRA